jgi:3-hydroxyacyl-CoA dehydrogenase/enoyl-CoA hydratase/3-hydroxybutyryl-CoA epimerase
MSAFTSALEQGIAVVTFDAPGAPVNTISQAVGEELAALLDRLGQDPVVRGIVLLSGKPDSFIAGADINEFVALRTAADASALSRRGQELMQRVESLGKPVVAAIHGSCIGGAVELALACQWRVASDHPKTQLQLSEVQLGILPGAGGCTRLPRLVGLRAALDMILTGSSVRAAKAKKIGLVDELVHPAVLRETAVRAADRLVREGPPERERGGGASAALLDRTALGRRIVYRGAKQQLLKKTGGHYPAPLAALEVVRTGLEQGMEAGFAAEAQRFGELAVTGVSRNLVRLFFATTALKKDDGVPVGSVSEVTPVARLGVVGSGFMGAGIAGTAALKAEVEVRLRDAELSRVGKGLKAATTLLDERLKRRHLSRAQHQRLAALLTGTDGYHGFGRTDLVIEAVFEDLGVKRTVMAELEAVVRDDTVLATNTSTIPIADIAAMARRPERVLGMHFFSPVEKMPLVEVIPHAGTAPRAVARAVRFGRRMGKTVIVVGDRPGFWVNRILTPYLNEAGRLLLEGVPVEIIDRTMTDFGFPVGPVTLLDEVGLDVAQKAAGVMHAAFGARLAPADVVGRMIADGRLGRKSGRGFHLYEDGRKGDVDEKVYELLGVKPLPEVSTEMVHKRLVYAMLNEAAMAAGEGVVRSPRDGDLGAIFGIGYPPFRGGPLRLIDDLGPAQVVATLRDLSLNHGDRFRPAESLVAMAGRGGTFHRDD